MYTDIHSHSRLFVPNQAKVVSLLVHPEADAVDLCHDLHPQLYFSLGAHPWYAAEWNTSNLHLLDNILTSSCIMIGEIGLDNTCDSPIEVQILLFEKQLQLAESSGLPVLIHNVGHQERLMAMKKKYKNIPTWIIHGFHGKKPEATQYLQNGFHLSFGQRYHVESLRECPMDRLFLETDEANMDLGELYAIVAKEKSLPVELLEQQVCLNFESILRK